MTNSQTKYFTNKLSKWLLTASIFFSVFAFSGFSNNTSHFYINKVQTELVFFAQTTTKKLATAFKKTVSIAHHHFFLNNLNDYLKKLLLTYNKLIKVKLEDISKKYQSRVQADKFLPIKIIPHTLSTNIFISIG